MKKRIIKILLLGSLFFINNSFCMESDSDSYDWETMPASPLDSWEQDCSIDSEDLMTLEERIDDAITNKKIDYVDNCGETFLFEAIKKDKPKLVKKLIRAGFSLKHQNYLGDTPLHTAAYHGKLEIVKTILFEEPNMFESLIKIKNINNEIPYDSGLEGSLAYILEIEIENNPLCPIYEELEELLDEDNKKLRDETKGEMRLALLEKEKVTPVWDYIFSRSIGMNLAQRLEMKQIGQRTKKRARTQNNEPQPTKKHKTSDSY